jgi:formylglycine-generating enzyme required for sulfatase activity
MSQRTVVILIHGIRTAAWWQDRVASILETDANVTVIPLKYGYFDILRFWCPFRICRNGPIERLRQELEGIRENYRDARVVVFAHSYGTYALSQILLENPYFKFDRIILCGSIIRENFDWRRVENQILSPNKRDAIINECGLRDVWPVFARSASWGYGATGTFGFGTYGVRDRFHPLTHSEFFKSEFVRKYWVPAVADTPPVPTSGTADQGTPAWFRFLRAPIRWLLVLGIPALLAVIAWAIVVPPCPYCPEMVEIPPGSFMMGASETRPGRFERISSILAVGKYPVTFAEWDACVANGGCDGYRPNDHGWGRGRRPVINVSWNDAKNYVAWLSKKTGEAYRLPTNVEREYFTRAGTNTKYWWGNEINARQANFSSRQYAKSDAPNRTMPIDAFEPNPWGLYQVHGNIWEWVEDCRYEEGGICKMRVLRGGGWDMDADILQSSNSGQNIPDVRSWTVGFRVVKTLRAR